MLGSLGEPASDIQLTRRSAQVLEVHVGPGQLQAQPRLGGWIPAASCRLDSERVHLQRLTEVLAVVVGQPKCLSQLPYRSIPFTLGGGAHDGEDVRSLGLKPGDRLAG